MLYTETPNKQTNKKPHNICKTSPHWGGRDLWRVRINYAD